MRQAQTPVGDLIDAPDDDLPEEFGFFLHLRFCADDRHDALHRAERWARTLNRLSSGAVDCWEATVTDGRAGTVPIFCLAFGPDPEDVCLQRAGHTGRHAGPGWSDTWTDDQARSVSRTGLFGTLHYGPVAVGALTLPDTTGPRRDQPGVAPSGVDQRGWQAAQQRVRRG